MKIIIIILITCFSLGFIQAQNRQVKGMVSDDKGPVAGASVIQKGVTPVNGISADENGRFTLTLKGNTNTLIISAINYLSKEVKATGNMVIVTLSTDPKTLDEVVVLGYGKQKKITVTGSVVAVAGEQIRQNPAASLQNGLVGRLPGFSAQQNTGQPGKDGAAFYIRGVSTYNDGGNTPLIVVDDIEYDAAQVALLDPNEIESISILKDASTTAVYGIKGANGVMVITTRRGKLGAPKISFRTEYSSMQPTILPNYLDAYHSAMLFDSARVHDGLPIPYLQSDLDLFQNGQDPYGHPTVDWAKVLFKNFSHQTRYNFDISGGTEKVKYFASVGYINQGGILNDFSNGQGYDGNYYNHRFNYRSNLDIKVTPTLDVKIDLFGNTNEVNSPNIKNSSTNGGQNNAFYEYSSFLSLAPWAYPITNPNGSWGYSNWQMNPNSNSNYNGNNIIARLSLGGYNRDYNNNMNFAANINQKLDFITKGLSAKAVLAYASQYSYSKGLTRTNIPSYIYNAVANSYTVKDATIYTLEKLNSSYTSGQTFRELSVQGFLNYDRNFGMHHVYGLVLINQDSKWAQVINSSKVINPTYNYIPVNYSGSSYRVGYDYKNKYLFQFNIGRNGTDRFSPANGKQYGYFPAVSGGWNLAEENLFKKILPVFNQFKLRGSYGLVGSDKLPNTLAYSYRNDYLANGSTSRPYQGNFGISSTPVTSSIQEGTIANADVTWEKQKELDLGLDFALFNKKLSGSFDYFNNNRFDILTNRGTVSQIFGQNLPPVNLGKVNNRGFEIVLTFADNIGKDFGYTLSANYAVAKNKQVFIDEPHYQYAYQQTTGQPIGNPLVYKWTGHFYTDAADIAKSTPVSSTLGTAHPGDLKYEDVNGDGIIDASDRGFFAAPNLPNTNYGFSLEGHYKGISISALFQGTRNGASWASLQAFYSNLTNLHAQAWTPALGDNALYPRLSTASNLGLNDPNSVNSTFWYHNTDYLRLRTAQISYQLPKSLLNKLKINDIRVYVNGNNLLTWSKFFSFYGLDPEVAAGAAFTPYPTQRTFNLGLNLTF